MVVRRSIALLVMAMVFGAAPAGAQSSIHAWGRYCYDTRGRSEPIARVAAGEFASATLSRTGRIAVNGFCYGGHVLPTLAPGLRFTDVKVCLIGGAALVSDGTVVTWGAMALSGQYPLAPTFPPTPSLPSGVRYVDIALGERHVIALRSDGVIVGWGNNSGGQCNVPAIPPGVYPVRVVAKRASSFAILSDGSVLAWGVPVDGVTPLPVFPAAVIDLHAGDVHGVAVCADGSAVAWGDNTYGSCNVPPLPVGTSYVKCCAGLHFSCALRSDGVIVQWGTNHASNEPPPIVPPGVNVLQMSSGYQSSIVLFSNGEVRSWGDNHEFGARVPGLPFTSVPDRGPQFVDSCQGYWHACAIRSDGGIATWGRFDRGVFAVPPSLQSAKYVKSGANLTHCGALRDDGQLFLWGDNSVGQCNVPPLPPGSRYVDFACGHGHTVALRSDGQAVAFGWNGGGQLFVPPLPSGVTYVQCDAQYDQSLYLRSDGHLVASPWLTPSPPAPPIGLEYTDMSLGEGIAAAVRSDGTPHWWGTSLWTPPAPTGSGASLWRGLSTMPPLPFGVYYVDVDCGHSTAIWRRSDGTISISGSVFYGEDTLPRLEHGTSYLGVTAGWDTVSGRVGPTCTYVSFAPGCAGSMQAARIVPRDTPRIGRAHQVTLFDLPANVAVLGMGFARPPQPVSLAAFGMPGCSLEIDVDAAVPLTGQWNRARFSLPIPDRLGLIGLHFYQQALVLDPAAGNAAGAVVSNAAEGVIGFP